MNWQPLDPVAPASLTSARLQLHYAAYILASVAHSTIEHAADDSHSNLGFDATLGSLTTRDLGRGLHLHLDIVAFELVVRSGSETAATFPLYDETLDSTLAHLGEALAARGVTTPLARREYPDFPESPIMTGGAFEKPDDDALRAHRAWFANALELFEGLRAREPRMTEPRVWPHHFDLGSLIPLSEDGASTIGLGYAPGDHSFDQPYFYCSPYPVPDASRELPELDAGAWTTDGFTSAILTAGQLHASSSQGETAQRYLDSAVARCRELIGA